MQHLTGLIASTLAATHLAGGDTQLRQAGRRRIAGKHRVTLLDEQGEMGIHISVRLYNRLLALLPPEASGRTELELADGSTVQAVIDNLGLSGSLPVAVNGVIEEDLGRILIEGDEVSVFAPVAGG